MRAWIRRNTNLLLSSFGVRLVSTRWGPRGPFDSLRRVRAHGVVPRQIVDAGASDGKWTRQCLEVFPDARYLLVDPLETNGPALDSLHRRHSNVNVWHGALGRTTGMLDLIAHGDQSSFLSSTSFPARGVQPVTVRPLDSFLGTELLQAPDLIKADVQGFELEVLRGATVCLETAQLLLLEVSFRRTYSELPLAHEIISFVGTIGFRIYDICTYSARPSDSELTQSDILFARDGSPLFANETWD